MSALDPYSGKKYGKYQIIEKIDEGGMAIVFKGQDERGDIVALKIPNDIALSDDNYLTRFFEEILNHSNIDHPNIVSYLNHFFLPENKVPVLVMEYLKGKNLYHAIKEKFLGEVFTLEDAIKLFRGICDGVKFIHEKNIVHRDLSTVNVFITDNLTPKLLDFGIAKGFVSARVTQRGQLLLKAHYAAPEVFDNKYSNKSDIYALGIIFYEILFGDIPFDAETEVELRSKHEEAEIPKIDVRLKLTENSIDEIYCKMLAKNPDQRYQSMDEVIRDFDQLKLSGTEKQIKLHIRDGAHPIPPTRVKTPVFLGKSNNQSNGNKILVKNKDKLGNNIVIIAGVVLIVVFSTIGFLLGILLRR